MRPMVDDGGRDMTTGQVARLVGVASHTVCKWFDSGMLKGYRIPMSQDRRVPRRNLREFLLKHGLDDAAARIGGNGVLFVGFPASVRDTIAADGTIHAMFADNVALAGHSIAAAVPAVVVVNESVGRTDAAAVLRIAAAASAGVVVVGRDDVHADAYLDAGADPAAILAAVAELRAESEIDAA